MAIKNKKPPVKESVGAQYICFATESENVDYDGTYEVDVEKTEVVKNVSVSENSESTAVKASGKDYVVVSSSSGSEISVEVIAFVAETLAKMRGDIISASGLITTNLTPKRPFFAYGKVVKLLDGKYRYDWYPKCQLSANTDDIATKEESFSEQNDKLTIKAMAFNDNGDVKQSIMGDFKMPDGLTEDLFFSKPILSDDDLTSLLSSPKV